MSHNFLCYSQTHDNVCHAEALEASPLLNFTTQKANTQSQVSAYLTVGKFFQKFFFVMDVAK
jgi:hypothetical protein